MGDISLKGRGEAKRDWAPLSLPAFPGHPPQRQTQFGQIVETRWSRGRQRVDLREETTAAKTRSKDPLTDLRRMLQSSYLTLTGVLSDFRLNHIKKRSLYDIKKDFIRQIFFLYIL